MWPNPQFTEEILNGKLHFFVQWNKEIKCNFLQKKDCRKKKMDSSLMFDNPLYRSMDFVRKWGNWFISFTNTSSSVTCHLYGFICLKMFIMQWRKNIKSWDEIKRMGSYKQYLQLVSYVCLIRLTQNQNEQKKPIV